MTKTPYQLAMLRAALVCLLGVICLAAVLLSSGCALKVGVGAAAVADYHSTRLAIANVAHEANPIAGQGAVRQAVVKAVGATGGLGVQAHAQANAQTTAEIKQQVAEYHQKIESDDAAWSAAGWIVAGNLADAVSTELVLASPSAYEANPLLGQSRTQRLVVKSAMTAAQVFVARKIAKRHPKLAKGLGYGIGAVTTGAALWNVSRLRRAR